MRYYTISRLSEHMEMTPEGYLLCRDVPIARTGTLKYLPEEVPEDLSEDYDGEFVLVEREAVEIFAPATIASYEGKSITVYHPEEDFVGPDNWKELTDGLAQNVRPGKNAEADLLLADILITDAEAIELVLSGELREVSCGYDADYEKIAPGRGRQVNIIGNHIALVEAGRCGSRCAIKDEESIMGKATLKRSGFFDRIFKNPKVKKAMDEAAAEEAAKAEKPVADNEEPPAQDDEPQQTATDSPELAEKLDEILILLRSLVERLPAADEDPAEDDEAETGNDDPTAADDDPEPAADNEPDGEGHKTGDSARRMRTADRAVLESATVLAPGLRFNVGDSAVTVKRLALRQAMSDRAVARVVEASLGGRALDRADSRTLDAAFAAASVLCRERNNLRTGSGLSGATRDGKQNGPTTPADINKINKEYRDSLSKK